MFKIQPIQSKEDQMRFAKACGTEYKEGYFGYVMIDQETLEIMGFSQFEIEKGVGYISDIREPEGRNDFEAMFILGRSTMNFIDICGAHIARAPFDAADASLMLSIGFKEKDGYLEADMSNMFSGKCHGN